MDFASPVFVWLVPWLRSACVRHSTKTGSALQVKPAFMHLLCFGQKSAQGRWIT
jgi:hypothetical protein